MLRTQEKLKEILEYWEPRSIEIGTTIDFGEPTCWACGQTWEGRYDKSQETKNSFEILWVKAPLQICHIVPKSLNGADTADNLLLLCKECHDNAPNTSIAEIMIEWVKNSPHYLFREVQKIQDAMKVFLIPEIEHDEFSTIINDPKFKEWISNKTGIHRPQSSYSGIGKKLTASTVVGLAKYYRNTELGKY